MPMINGMFTNLPDDYNRGYSPVPQNYGLAMAVENLRGDNQTLPQSFNDKLNSIAEASLKAAQLKRTMNQQPQEDLKSNLQKRLDERKARAVGMSELLKNRTNDEFNKRLYDSYIESKLGPVSKKEDFNGLFSPIPQSLPPPETKTRNTTDPQYTPIPDSYKALLEKDKQSEQPAKAKSAEAKPSTPATDRSKDFIERYKNAARNATMELDPVSFQSNINVAMRDPVYGNATAAGLATGQNLLNSWIAGNNAKARRDKESLSDMRWIKQMEDADEERAYRAKRDVVSDDFTRQRLDLAKKQIDYNKLQDEKREMGWLPESIPEELYFANDPKIKSEYKQLMQDPSLKRQMYRTLEERDRLETAREGVLAKLAKIRESAPRSMLPDMTEFDRRVDSGQYKNRSGRLLDRRLVDAKWLGGLTDWEGQVSDLVKRSTGDGRIRTFANPMQYTNLLRMFGMEDEARDFEKIITQNLRDIGRIEGLAIGNSPVSPMYIRTNRGLGVVDPITGKIQFLNQTVTDTDGK